VFAERGRLGSDLDIGPDRCSMSSALHDESKLTDDENDTLTARILA